MKYLLVLLVVALMIWMARAGKRAEKVKAEKAKRSAAPTQDVMVACAQCDVHLPRSDAVQSGGHWFCGVPHRVAFERAAPPR